MLHSYVGTNEYGERLNIRTNDRGRPRVSLLGRAKVLRAVRVEMPPEQRDLFRAPLLPRSAGPPIMIFTLLRGDGGPLSPRVAAIEPYLVNAPGPGWFNVDAELREIQAGEQYKLIVVAAPPWPDGSLCGDVILDTGVAEQPRGEVMFHVRMPLRLAYDGDRLHVPPNRDAELVLTTPLRWSDDAPVPRIHSVTSPAPGLSAEVAVQDGQQVLRMRVSPECAPPQRGEYHLITLETDDPLRPRFCVAVHFGRPKTPSGPWDAGTAPAAYRPCRVQVEPETWDFGTVWQGADLRGSFAVRNVDDEAFEIVPRGGPSAHLVGHWPSGLLAPGATQSFEVVFDTSQTGAQRGTVVIRANGSWLRTELSIRGQVKPTHELRPGRIVSFGAGGAAWTVPQSVEVINLYTEPMSPSILSVRSWPQDARYDVRIEALEAGRRFRVTVTAQEPVPERFCITLIELATGWDTLPKSKMRIYVLANEARRPQQASFRSILEALSPW